MVPTSFTYPFRPVHRDTKMPLTVKVNGIVPSLLFLFLQFLRHLGLVRIDEARARCAHRCDGRYDGYDDGQEGFGDVLLVGFHFLFPLSLL